MIINLKKYLILGSSADLDKFFTIAQAHGFLEFISISGKKSVDARTDITELLEALKILRKQPLKKPYLGGGEVLEALEIAKKIIYFNAEIEKLHEEIRLLNAEIARVSPFGDFSREDLEYIEKYGKKKIQFFCMKSAKSHKTNFTDEVIYIGTEFDLDYFIAINPTPRHYPDMIEMRIDRPLGELKLQLEETKVSLMKMEAELKDYAGHIEFLHEILIELLNDHHLSQAIKEVSYPLENSVFAVEAWVPENKVGSLYAMIDGMRIYCEEILIEETDKIPTCMENKGTSRMGEDLVKIYDVPSHTDKDPSPWVFWAFVLFFAMIVSDAGYGLLYLATALFIKWKFPNLTGSKKRLLKLFIILSSACVIWGVLISSYFGMKIDAYSFLGRVSVVKYLAAKKAQFSITGVPIHKIVQAAPIGDISLSNELLDEFSRDVLLEVSLIIGIVHIILSLFRYLNRNWANIGWVAFLIGGYLFFPTTLNAATMLNVFGVIDQETARKVGLQLIYGGIGLALFLSLLQKKLKGLAEITNLVQVFADVLSYLRLYALALAGSIMAETFNGIGQYIGLVAGIIAAIVGHFVNILLGIMAGVIHGLRLNFLEWYHYCFEGNGKLFNPLRKIKNK